MKHYLLNIPYFVIFFACFLCGCSSEEGSDVLKSKELSIECFVDGECLTTRAIKTTSYFTAGDDIGVWAFKDNGSAYSNNQNVWVRYNGAVWRFHNSIPMSSEDATVYACYPWSGESTNNAETYIYPGTVDYLYGSCYTKNNADNPRAILRFEHAMARLTFRFKLTSDSDPNDILAPYLVYLWLTDDQNILINKAMLDVRTGSITAIETGKPVEMATVQKLTRNNYAIVDMLVVPCNLGSGKVTLHFSINGEHYQEDLQGDDWQAGQQYTYDVPVHLTHWNQDVPQKP